MNAHSFQALVVTEDNNNQFKQAIVTRNVADLPDNDLLIDVH